MDHIPVLHPEAATSQGELDHSPSSGEPNVTVLRLDARALTLFFVAIEVAIAATFVVLAALRLLDHEIASIFNVDHEGNIPAWFSGMMFFIAAIPAAVRGLQMRQADRRSPYRIYLVAAAGLAFLSMDEVAQVHDRMDRIVAIVLYAGVGLVLLAVLRREVIAMLREKAGRRSLVGGIAAFLFGAVIMDFSPNRWWSPERAIEEFAEMLGATLIFFGMAARVRPFMVVVASKELSYARIAQ